MLIFMFPDVSSGRLLTCTVPVTGTDAFVTVTLPDTGTGSDEELITFTEGALDTDTEVTPCETIGTGFADVFVTVTGEDFPA